MNENSRSIDAVVGISTEVIAAIHDHAFPTCGRKPLGDYQPGKASADDEKVGGVVSLQKVLKRIEFPSSCRPWSISPDGRET